MIIRAPPQGGRMLKKISGLLFLALALMSCNDSEYKNSLADHKTSAVQAGLPGTYKVEIKNDDPAQAGAPTPDIQVQIVETSPGVLKLTPTGKDAEGQDPKD